MKKVICLLLFLSGVSWGETFTKVDPKSVSIKDYQVTTVVDGQETILVTKQPKVVNVDQLKRELEIINSSLAQMDRVYLEQRTKYLNMKTLVETRISEAKKVGVE